jgi:hypothetical protein
VELERPRAPELGKYQAEFRPAHDLAEWLKACFVKPGGVLANPDHVHLVTADLACLWTNVPFRRGGRIVAATMAMAPHVQGSGWVKARGAFQLERWFGREPRFLATFQTDLWEDADDFTACARAEHELYHAGQATDEYGCLKFKQNGDPCFALRGHDAEEFVGVVARYGVNAAAGGVRELVAAALKPPSIGEAQVAAACGTCGRAL